MTVERLTTAATIDLDAETGQVLIDYEDVENDSRVRLVIQAVSIQVDVDVNAEAVLGAYEDPTPLTFDYDEDEGDG